jgi:hypothetical protein
LHLLFRKKINNNNPDTFELIPEDIIFGYYDEDYGMFVTKDALGYPHFFEELEKHVFGFNKPINEYLDKYYKNNISYDEAINLLTKDIKNKRYLCDFQELTQRFVTIKEKGKGGKVSYSTDDVCDAFNQYLEAEQYESEDYIETEEYERPVPIKVAKTNNKTSKVDTIKLYKTLKEHIIG